MKTPPAISLVIPAYCEEAGIVEAVGEAREALIALGHSFEIIVVDDGSHDNTARRVRELSNTWSSIRLISHATNKGYGAALRTGFENAQGTWVAFTDADSQFFIEDLRLLIERIDDFPIVIGRRIDRQDPWRRRFLSWGYNVLIRTLFDTQVKDIDCALKLFRKEVLEYLLPNTRGFFVNTEMLAKARAFGWPITQVNVRHRPRRHGTSKVSLKEIPKTLKTIAQYWFKLKFQQQLAHRPIPRATVSTLAYPATQPQKAA